MTDPPTTFRCGWRIQRDRGLLHPSFYQGVVLVRRGEFRVQMPAEFFDAMADADFVGYINSIYREAVFQQSLADLDVLARQLVGELNATGALAETDVPVDDVKAVLYRWQKAERDRGASA